jgi:Peptidase_C39 like family
MVVGMRHDNDVNAVTTIGAKALNFVRTHLSTPRRAATYGLLAVVGAGALAMAGPATTQAATPTTTQAATPTTTATAQTSAAVAAHAATPKTAATAATAKRTTAAAATPSKHRASSKELRVNYQPQPNYYWCGPAATRNALTAAGHNVTMASLARTMGTTEAGTNSAYDITAALNKVTRGNKYRTTELAKPTITAKQADTLKRDVVTTIDDNRAVVANVAGTATDTEGRTHSYEGGHYIAVHGYRDNGRQVKIADSADPKSAHYWMDTNRLASWMATRGYSH